MLVFRTSLVDDSEDDYWVKKARTLLNLSLQEATDLLTYTKKQSIKEYVEWLDELQMSHGQLHMFNDADIGTLNRLYMMKPEKVRYFGQSIEQISSELKLLPPAI